MMVLRNSSVPLSVVCDSAIYFGNIGRYDDPTGFLVQKGSATPIAGVGTFNGEVKPGLPSATTQFAATAWITLAPGDTDTLGSLVVLMIDANGRVVGKRYLQVVAALPAVPGDNMGLDAAALAAITAIVTSGALSLDTLFDGTHTVQQFFKAAAAVLAGTQQTQGPIALFRNWAGTRNVVTANLAPGGQRVSITFDFS